MFTPAMQDTVYGLAYNSLVYLQMVIKVQLFKKKDAKRKGVCQKRWGQNTGITASLTYQPTVPIYKIEAQV